MTVRDVARDSPLVTARPSTPLREVAEMMEDNAVGSVVVTTTDAPVGIVTDRDVALAVGADATGTTAADVMAEDPITVPPDIGVLELTARMAEETVRRVPVVEDGGLVGIVTLDDLVRLLTVELANLSSVVNEESPPY